jgi:cell volume regulation protein A
MGFGLLVGPVLGLFGKDLFLEMAPLMSVLALSIILFEAGINVDIVILLESMAKATFLSVSSILTVILVVGFSLNFFMPQNFTLLEAMLLGSMIGGTSTVSVYGIMASLKDRSEDLSNTKVLLTMESIISDPVCIIASITLIKMIMLPNVSISESLRDIFSIFSLSSILGLVIGLFWGRILNSLRGKPLTYMITLAVLLPSYIISESIIGEGGGAMTTLCFGLAISNYKYIAEKIGIKSKIRIDKQRLREFHEEITFFIKSFFFVYIGLVVSLSWDFYLIGFGIVFLIMLIRVIIVQSISGVLKFSREEKILSEVVYASGLPAFVMSQLPMIFDPQGNYFVNPSIYPNLCMPIVLGTVIYSGILGPYMIKRTLKTETEEKREMDKTEKVKTKTDQV